MWSRARPAREHRTAQTSTIKENENSRPAGELPETANGVRQPSRSCDRRSSDRSSTVAGASSPQHAPRATKVVHTALACVGAAFVTYPAEASRLRWEINTLRQWHPEKTVQHSNERRRLRVVTPLVRLITNELVLAGLTSVWLSRPTAVDDSPVGQNPTARDAVAGAVAGFFQALLLAPAELYYAHRHMHREMSSNESWVYWLKSHVFDGGTIDPHERRARAFRGIGVIAAREIIFNVTFFPLFHHFQRASRRQNESARGQDIASSPSAHVHSHGRRNATFEQITGWSSNHVSSAALSNIVCGIAAGMTCSLAVVPMDMLKTHLMFSRERWHFWSGRTLQAPPWNLLIRGLTLQAFCFGPVFGIVAAIYEMA